MSRERELFAGEFRGAFAAEGEHPFRKVVGIAELGLGDLFQRQLL
jgi:hypothetical protein